MKRELVLLLAFGLVLPGAVAAGVPELLPELRFSDPDSWIGVPRDDLVAQWGKPTKVKQSRDGTLLLFERSVMMGFAAAASSEVSYSREKNNEDGKNRLVPDAPTNVATDVVFEKMKFKFWLDGSDRVVKVKFPADLKEDPHKRTFVATPAPDAIPDPGRP